MISFSVSVCNFYTAKLLFQRNNKFDLKALFARSPVSRLIKPGDITKRILGKGYLVPQDFSWIENYKLIQRHHKIFKYLILQNTCVHRRSSYL